jgi:hypothetical protein
MNETETAPAPDTQLSPAAEAVFTAILNLKDNINPRHRIAAAALRAAADQVVPDAANYLRAAINSVDWWDAHDQIRAELLAIAAELEGTNG